MEIVDKRKLDAEVPEVVYDTFEPTLAGCVTVNSVLVVRILRLPEKNLVAVPDAYAAPVRYGEVVSANRYGYIVRFPENIGTTVEFSDGLKDEKYLEIREEDVTLYWEKK